MKCARLRFSELRRIAEATARAAAPEMKPDFAEVRKHVRGDPAVQGRPTQPTTPLIVRDANGKVLERWCIRIPLGARGGANFWIDLLPGQIGDGESIVH